MTHNALLCLATSMLAVAIESIMLGVVMLNAVELYFKIEPIQSVWIDFILVLIKFYL